MKKNQKKKTASKSKKKTVLIIIGVVIVVAVLAGLGIKAYLSRGGEEAEWQELDVSPRVEGAADLLTEESPAAENTDDEQPPEEDSGEPSEEPDEETGEETGEESGDSGLIGYTGDLFDRDRQGVVPSAQGGELVEVEIPTISFPYSISDTGLVVEQISPYSGYYLEDASDDEISNVAAIVLTNNGGDLDFVGIGIAQGDRSLAFSASQVPAGATVIIQEQSRAAYEDGNYYSCTATTTESDGFQASTDTIRVEDNGDNSFLVANIGEETVPEVRVFFKNYLPEEDVYVGGITYNVTVTDLEPGMATIVTPGHYDSNYSIIMDIQTGE